MSHESNEDPELAAWRGEWQGLGGTEDFAAQLVARARKDGRRLRRSAAVEVTAAALSSTFAIWLVVHRRGALEAVLLMALILLFNGAILAHFFTVRAGTFASSGDGVEAFVALTRRRFRTQKRWAGYARRWLLVLLVAVVPWAALMLHAHWDGYAAQPWRGVVGFGGIFVIAGGVLAWIRRTELRLVQESEAFERQLADVQLAP
jgi:hypothetical protein